MKIVKIKNASDIYIDIGNYDITSRGTVVALGFFDGVHIAHRSLIAEAKKASDESSLPLIIFTFSGADAALKSSVRRLLTDEEKLALLEECGADCTVIADFSVFKEMQAENFVCDFLIQRLNARVAVCGFNFRFGKDAAGDCSILHELMHKSGRSAKILSEYTKSGKTVSSTDIKRLIESKKLTEAALLLGKPYFLSGKVSHGFGLGKKLGIPTINMNLPAGKFIPPNGVYFTITETSSARYVSMTNVGSCPTFEERPSHAETFILDFDENLYDCNVKIYFIRFLREEKKFSSAEELIMQIKLDKKQTLKLSGELKWQELGLN